MVALPSGRTDIAPPTLSPRAAADLFNELCHVGSPGEMFTSSAPQDPTFWPLHGNAERYVQYLRVLKKAGTVPFDEAWGFQHETEVPSDTGMVCDWTGVTDVTDMPTCAKATCPGHKEDDLLPFTHLFKAQGESLMTNAQMYAAVDPFHDDLPYAYDSLSYWEGCTDHSLLAEYTAVTGDPLTDDGSEQDDDKSDDADAMPFLATAKNRAWAATQAARGAATQWWGVM